jgi:signal transduction histidine kinase/DNA-binding LacI/PurR family transcriptional regulator
MVAKSKLEATILRSKVSRPTIGIFRNNSAGDSHRIQWEGLSAAAKTRDVNLICYAGGLLNARNGAEVEASRIYQLVSAERVDGLVIWTGNLNWNTSPKAMERFIKSFAPLPVVSVEVEIAGAPSLLWDDFGGMRTVINHLIEVHKCRRIVFFRGSRTHIGMEQRYQAYLHTLAEHGIPFDPDLVWLFDLFFQGEAGLQILTEKLTSTRIDGIAVCNDFNARLLVNLMQAKGLPVLPIVGFDDAIEGRAGRPALTTVRAPFYEIGYRAVEVLLEMVEGRPVKQLERLPCSMVVRRSCGCSSRAITREAAWEAQSIDCRNSPAEPNPDEFAKLVAGLVKVTNKTVSDWAPKLMQAFLMEARGSVENIFLTYLEEVLDSTTNNGEEIDIWQDIILALFSFTKAFIKGKGYDALKAERLLRQGMTLIAENFIRSEIYTRLQESSRQFNVINFNHTLSEAFGNINLLLQKIENGLIQLGISSCYLSLYENRDMPTGQARLILAYDIRGHKILDPETAIFPAKQLLPNNLLSQEKCFNYILKSLFFQKRQIGFVLFEAGAYDLPIYELLSNIISVSINGVMMIEELGKQAAELSKANVDLENAYQSLQENQQKLLIFEKMASLGRLTAGIAHEMNTPLAAVRTAIKELSDLVAEYQKSIGNPTVLLEDHRAIAADMAKHLKLAGQAAEKSAGFIRGIKTQTIDMKFTNLQLFNAAFVISDALNVVEFVIKKGLCVLVTSLDNSIELYGDPRRLVQIINNLVMNAVEACQPGGGTVTVRLANNGSGFAELTVEDTGCGIPETIMSQIFDPMFTTKPFGEGTGLGLSIVHDLVNEYKGSIKVSSRKGLTSFVIMLPLK